MLTPAFTMRRQSLVYCQCNARRIVLGEALQRAVRHCESSNQRSADAASWPPSFYGKVGDGCPNPPELARLIVRNPPSLSDHLMVVRVGAPSDNEIRMMRPSAISGSRPPCG